MHLNDRMFETHLSTPTVFLVRMKVASRELPYSGCRVAVLDPKFAQESESGLESAQSPAGKDENCMQSMTGIYRQSSLASRPAGGWPADFRPDQPAAKVSHFFAAR